MEFQKTTPQARAQIAPRTKLWICLSHRFSSSMIASLSASASWNTALNESAEHFVDVPAPLDVEEIADTVSLMPQELIEQGTQIQELIVEVDRENSQGWVSERFAEQLRRRRARKAKTLHDIELIFGNETADAMSNMGRHMRLCKEPRPSSSHGWTRRLGR